jgi:hypothetical protein
LSALHQHWLGAYDLDQHASAPIGWDRLGCLRDISTLTGFGLAVESGEWDRLTGTPTGPDSTSCAIRPARFSPAARRRRSYERGEPPGSGEISEIFTTTEVSCPESVPSGRE